MFHFDYPLPFANKRTVLKDFHFTIPGKSPGTVEYVTTKVRVPRPEKPNPMRQSDGEFLYSIKNVRRSQLMLKAGMRGGTFIKG